MNGADALNLRFTCQDLDGEVSIREYMQELLATLFAEGESFSGKRPFGNSGWEHDIVRPLVEAGLVTGVVDDEGYVESFRQEEYDAILAQMIEAL